MMAIIISYVANIGISRLSLWIQIDLLYYQLAMTLD